MRKGLSEQPTLQRSGKALAFQGERAAPQTTCPSTASPRGIERSAIPYDDNIGFQTIRLLREGLSDQPPRVVYFEP